jgi:hypothetical protein
MKKKLLVLLFSLATLGLVSCGGGNEGASTGTPVVAQATIFDPTANGGCVNSGIWGYGGTGPWLNLAQQTACINAVNNAATNAQCIALGGGGGLGGWYYGSNANTSRVFFQCSPGGFNY